MHDATARANRTVRSARSILRVIVVAIAMIAGPAAADTIYVERDAPQGGDGSHERPLRSIQEAIRRSRDGDVILVGPGEYEERLRFLGRQVEVRSTDGADTTTLDGARDGSVVRFVDGETRGTILAGFTIRRGTGEPSAAGLAGGGILVVDASPTLRRLRLEFNGADVGAGLAAFGGSPRLLDCDIVSNESRFTGGGFFFEAAEPILEQCRLHSNRAIGARNFPTGGAIHCVSGRLEMHGCDVDGNVALNGHGGGIVLSAEANATVNDSRFAAGSATFGFGGGIAIVEGSILTMSHSTVVENAAESGGGIGCSNAFLALEGNRIERNVATERTEGRRQGGGGIALFEGAAAALYRDTIADNTATFVGGLRTSVGGGSSVHSSQLRIREVLFQGNKTTPGCGGAAFADGSLIESTRSVYEGNRVTAIDRPTLPANGSGGAWHIERSDATFEGDRFDSNRAELEGDAAPPVARFGTGGALCVDASTLRLRSAMVTRNFAGRSGGGLEAHESVFEGRHVTFAANVASRGLAWSTARTHVDVDGSIVTRSLRGEALSRHVSTTLIDDADGDVTGDSVRRSFVDGRLVNGLDVSELRSARQGDNILHLDPGFVSVSRGDFRLRLGSVCIDLIEEGFDELPFDVDGEPRNADGDRDGLSLVDLGADELIPSVAVRYGSVLAPTDDLEDLLTVNDSAGDSHRVINLGRHQPWRVDLDAPAAGPASAAYVIYAWFEAPDPLTLFDLPNGLGLLGHPLPGAPETTGDPVVAWNTLGHLPLLGRATEPSSPAPTTLVDRPRGIGLVTTITLQGIVECDRSPSGFAVTNAVVVRTD